MQEIITEVNGTNKAGHPHEELKDHVEITLLLAHLRVEITILIDQDLLVANPQGKIV